MYKTFSNALNFLLYNHMQGKTPIQQGIPDTTLTRTEANVTSLAISLSVCKLFINQQIFNQFLAYSITFY